jgi:hypothetical protein
MIFTRGVGAILVLILLTGGAAVAEEKGSVLKADSLRAEPYRDAKVVGSLAAGDSVEILNKQGGWFHVKSVKGGGWIHMLSIRRGEARKGSVDATGLLGLASGRAGKGQVVATTGIRGLSEEELKAAKYNESELKKFESFGVTEAEARKFAAEGGLKPRKLDYLSEPETGKEER